jgi:hypothetical protein
VGLSIGVVIISLLAFCYVRTGHRRRAFQQSRYQLDSSAPQSKVFAPLPKFYPPAMIIATRESISVGAEVLNEIGIRRGILAWILESRIYLISILLTSGITH